MILLLGGIAETRALALGLAGAGCRVLVSTATDIPLDTGDHPCIRKRSGRLDQQGLTALIQESGIRLVIDAVHPYASEARSSARSAAHGSGIPCLSYVRPGSDPDGSGIDHAATHEQAALIAFSFQKPVLLSIGAKHIGPYAVHAGEVPLYVRVLPFAESIEACRRAGIPGSRIITGRGPFTSVDNRSLIRQHSIGVLVTKDSGKEGGVPEKLEAARLEGCRVIVVKRPELPMQDGTTFDSIDTLIASVQGFLQSE